MKNRWISLISFIFIAGLQSAFANSVLFVSMEEKENTLIITAKMDSDEFSFHIIDKNEILSTSNNIIDIVSRTNKGSKKTRAKLQNYIETVSQALLEPLYELIENAELINIKISNTSIRIPFEFLKIHGKYIFLQKPIVFSHTAIQTTDLSMLNLNSGLIVRDPDTDPENACGSIYEKKPNSKFYQTTEISVDTLRNPGNYNFILWSVHGGYHIESTQSILSINDQYFRPEWISQTSLELAYFDSCDLGKGINFLNHFTENGTRYYIAPIISNEAGNSSTKTIITYFKNLENSNPVEGMFNMKQELQTFAEGNELVELWYAAAFRLYKLN